MSEIAAHLQETWALRSQRFPLHPDELRRLSGSVVPMTGLAAGFHLGDKPTDDERSDGTSAPPADDLGLAGTEGAKAKKFTPQFGAVVLTHMGERASTYDPSRGTFTLRHQPPQSQDELASEEGGIVQDIIEIPGDLAAKAIKKTADNCLPDIHCFDCVPDFDCC